MDLETIKKFLRSPRPGDDYLAGVNGFLDFAYTGKSANAKIHCPCVKCVNRFLLKRNTVYEHLVCDGMLYIDIQFGVVMVKLQHTSLLRSGKGHSM